MVVYIAQLYYEDFILIKARNGGRHGLARKKLKINFFNAKLDLSLSHKRKLLENSSALSAYHFA